MLRREVTMIRLLREDDAHAFVTLRHEALLDTPFAFASSPEDDFVSNLDAVRALLRRAPESTIYGAFRDGLVGSVGLYRDTHLKSSHKAHLWGMYVSPRYRRQGIAVALLAAALRHAAALPGVSWVHLGVSSAAPEALRLYRAAGFECWGTEPEALRHAGHAVSEHHMALRLDSPPNPGSRKP
jgi:ribosomal protein S18 acetylase RimI-like enzyme